MTMLPYRATIAVLMVGLFAHTADAQTHVAAPPTMVRSGSFPTRDGILAVGVHVGEVSYVDDLDGDGRADALLVVGRDTSLSDELGLVIALHHASGWTGEQVAISTDSNVVRWLAPLEAHGQTVVVTEEDADNPGCHPRDEAQHRCLRHAFRYTLRSIAASGQSEVRYASTAGANEGPCDFVVGQDGTVQQRSLRGTTHAEAHGGSTVTWAPARERTLSEDAHGRSFAVGPWTAATAVVEGMPRTTGVQVVQ